MEKVKFIKMHGLGNDFVVLDARTQPLSLSESSIQNIADRKLGVGCDQVVVIYESDTAEVKVRFFNADGSESSTCGNATRCVAHYVMEQQGITELNIETSAGNILCELVDDKMVAVHMGRAQSEWDAIPLSRKEDTMALPIHYQGCSQPVAISMGNPHAIFFVEDVESVGVSEIGAEVEQHALFPERTNVEFVQVLGPDHIRLRVWERGTGETAACGSGACAAAVAAYRVHNCAKCIAVDLPGGTLSIAVDETYDVIMTGPVAYVFTGEVTL